MNKVIANKGNSKELQALRSQYPSANVPTEINDTDKEFYNILGYRTVKTNGAAIVLEHRVFTLSEFDYNKHELGGGLKAHNFGWEQLQILHIPSKIYAPIQESEEKAKADADAIAKKLADELAEKEAKAKADADAIAKKLADFDAIMKKSEELEKENAKMKAALDKKEK